MAFGKVLLNSELLLIAMIVFSTAIENDSTIPNHIKSNQPNYIKPLHYDIKFRFYVKRNVYIGECNSTIRINHETSNITMRFPTFGIIKIVLMDKNQTIYIPRYSVHRNHTVRLEFAYLSKFGNFSLLPDIYNLKMTYLIMMFRLGKDSYLGINGDKVLTRTGVEIMRVQQLIPWPTTIPNWLSKQAFKATFNISVKHHHSYKVLSNMPVLKKYEDKNGMLWTDFIQLPLKSAKHLTIVMTTFSNTVLLPDIQFWYRPNMTKLVEFAKTTVGKVAKFIIHLIRYFRKIAKLDYVVIEDPQYNDDETFGLIVQSAANIIYDENLDFAARKVQIAHLIARQMVFLWHGDADFWSKKNFDTFIGAYILDEIQESDFVMDLMVVQIQQESLRFITPSHVHPHLAIETNGTNVTKGNLHSISLRYIRPFAMWRLLCYLISDGIFWTSINKYIHAYNYLDTTISQSNNLWTIMENAIRSENSKHNLNIKSIIDIWTTKTYYPVLYVTQYKNYNAVEIIYVTSSGVIDEDTENWIPVSYTTQSSLNFSKIISYNDFFWLNSRNRSHRIQGINSDDWIIVNLRQIGYYRVNYDLENWRKLAHYLRNTYPDSYIHVLNRAQIVDDAYHFLLQKQLDYNTFWYVTSFLGRDTDYIAWFPMFKAFEHIMCIFPLEYGKDIKINMLRIVNELVELITYDEKYDDRDPVIYLREEIIKWACILRAPECRRTANMKLRNEIEKFETQNYTYWPKEWIFCKGTTVASGSSLISLWHMWLSTLDTRLLEFMACSENSTFIYDYLKRIKKEDQIELKAQYAYTFLFTVAKHAGNETMLKMILKNLYTDFNLSKSKPVDTIATLIVIVTHVHSITCFKEIEEFVKSYHPKEEQLFQAVRNKIRKRKLEYARQLGNYRFLT